jgi:hypothetical protein
MCCKLAKHRIANLKINCVKLEVKKEREGGAERKSITNKRTCISINAM